ncbi:MAG TPA: hypothetical protein VE199_05350 [Nitrososphaera sp.]|nr:hypothetical protein [Nitrososphaera sp.]
MQLTQQQIHFRERISHLKDFNEAFELVKSAVLQKFRMHRAGLSLILQMMPSNLGAYHVLGSNAIVMNSYLLAAVKKIAGSIEEYNSYMFMVLAHEYLHSLGVIDENTVRQMTFDLCRWMLGDDHTATKMAKEDPSTLYPELKSLIQLRFGREVQVIRNFDKTNQTYIQ